MRGVVRLLLVMGAACGSSGDGITVVVTGGEPASKPWHELTVEGRGFEAWNGRAVTVEIHSNVSRSSDRRGLGTGAVEAGKFSMVFPEVGEHGYYKIITVHIDTDADGACEESDGLWESVTSGVLADELVQFTTTSVAIGAGEACPYFD